MSHFTSPSAAQFTSSPNGRTRPAEFLGAARWIESLPKGSSGVASTDGSINITLHRGEIIPLGGSDCKTSGLQRRRQGGGLTTFPHRVLCNHPRPPRRHPNRGRSTDSSIATARRLPMLASRDRRRSRTAMTQQTVPGQQLGRALPSTGQERLANSRLKRKTRRPGWMPPNREKTCREQGECSALTCTPYRQCAAGIL